MNESCYETITFTNLNFAVFNFSAKIEVKSLQPKKLSAFCIFNNSIFSSPQTDDVRVLAKFTPSVIVQCLLSRKNLFRYFDLKPHVSEIVQRNHSCSQTETH